MPATRPVAALGVDDGDVAAEVLELERDAVFEPETVVPERVMEDGAVALRVNAVEYDGKVTQVK